MIDRIRQRIAELEREWAVVRTSHPRVAYGVLGAFALVAIVPAVLAIVFLVRLPKGLPDDTALSRIGEMDQATAVYDADDQLAFTIFKEQRIEVPLTSMSPYLVKAIIATED